MFFLPFPPVAVSAHTDVYTLVALVVGIVVLYALTCYLLDDYR